MTSFAKAFEPSSRAAAAPGPNTGMPSRRTASATPATSGAPACDRGGAAGGSRAFLREGFRALQSRRGCTGAEHRDALAADGIGHPGDQRRLRADDHQVRGHGPRQVGDRRRVLRIDRDDGGDLGDARVPRGDHHLGDGRVTDQGAGQSMFASAGADEQDLHSLEDTCPVFARADGNRRQGHQVALAQAVAMTPVGVAEWRARSRFGPLVKAAAADHSRCRHTAIWKYSARREDPPDTQIDPDGQDYHREDSYVTTTKRKAGEEAEMRPAV